MRAIIRNGAVAAAAIALCTGCTAPGDRTGGEPATVTLTFANPYAHFDYVPQVERFMDAVEENSGGGIVFTIMNEWRDFAPGLEQLTIEHVAAGEVDVAWVGTRAFDLVGETALQALTAPLLVDSEELEQAILDSDVPHDMMSAMGVDGVTPVASSQAGCGGRSPSRRR